jgi:hypothetical protein
MYKHTEEQVKDIVITAVEGGINYWAVVRNYAPDAGTVTVYEMDTDDPRKVTKIHHVTPATIRKGLRLASQSEHEHIRIMAASDILDAEEADVIVQLGLLGEVVYG